MTIRKLLEAAAREIISPLNWGMSAGVALVLTVILIQLGQGAWYSFPLLTAAGICSHVFWGVVKAIWVWDGRDKHEKRD